MHKIDVKHMHTTAHCNSALLFILLHVCYYFQVSVCELCPAGFSCNNSSLPPEVCELGQFSLLAEIDVRKFVHHCQRYLFIIYSLFYVQCSDCPSGFSCVDQSQPPFPCDEGHYSFQVMT